MRVIIFGPPGSGKGRYSRLISEKLGIKHIATGDIFRALIKKNTKIAKEVKRIMFAGGLQSDDLTNKIIGMELKKKYAKKGFILDGYPRTIPQAEMLEKFIKIDKVMNFVASEQVIVERLGGRRVCRKCGTTFHIKNMPPKLEGVCDNCGG